MAQIAATPWTVDEFLAWDERQVGRHELVGGFPLRMMSGVRNVHDEIVVNIVAELRNRLRGGPCRTFTGESGIETFPGQVRRPDVGIDCGRRDRDAYKAAEPRMVAEVMSPSTRDYDTFDKLGEYKAVETLDHILLVGPNAAEVMVWSRNPDRSWGKERVAGLERSVAMPALGLELPLAEAYDGIAFPPPGRFPP